MDLTILIIENEDIPCNSLYGGENRVRASHIISNLVLNYDISTLSIYQISCQSLLVVAPQCNIRGHDRKKIIEHLAKLLLFESFNYEDRKDISEAYRAQYRNTIIKGNCVVLSNTVGLSPNPNDFTIYNSVRSICYKILGSVDTLDVINLTTYLDKSALLPCFPLKKLSLYNYKDVVTVQTKPNSNNKYILELEKNDPNEQVILNLKIGAKSQKRVAAEAMANLERLEV
jgi:hypothetical protein